MKWRSVAVREIGRVVRQALKSWPRTIRLSVLIIVASGAVVLVLCVNAALR